MAGIKTDTQKLIYAGDILDGHCRNMKTALNEMKDDVMHLDECMYCNVVPAIMEKLSDDISDALRSVGVLGDQIRKLYVIAGEYEETERRNTNESDTLDRG